VCGWQVKLWSPCYTRAISERFRGAAWRSAIQIHDYFTFTLLYSTDLRLFTTMQLHSALHWQHTHDRLAVSRPTECQECQWSRYFPAQCSWPASTETDSETHCQTWTADEMASFDRQRVHFRVLRLPDLHTSLLWSGRSLALGQYAVRENPAQADSGWMLFFLWNTDQWVEPSAWRQSLAHQVVVNGNHGTCNTLPTAAVSVDNKMLRCSQSHVMT